MTAQNRDDPAAEPTFAGFVRDISERKRSEAALLSSAESFATLFEASVEGTVIARRRPRCGEPALAGDGPLPG